MLMAFRRALCRLGSGRAFCRTPLLSAHLYHLWTKHQAESLCSLPDVFLFPNSALILPERLFIALYCQCLSRRTLYPPPEREEVEGLRVLGVLAFFVEVDLLLADLEDDFEEEDDLLLTLERREVEEVRRRGDLGASLAFVPVATSAESAASAIFTVSVATESLPHTWRSKSSSSFSILACSFFMAESSAQ